MKLKKPWRETVITSNRIAGNRIAGVAIEHGTDNVIDRNEFAANRAGVSLWWDDDRALAVSAYCRNRSTESTAVVVRNRFSNDATAIELRDASSTILGKNEFDRVGEELVRSGRGTVSEASFRGWPQRENPVPSARAPVTGAGRAQIFVDEWGPYDGTGGLRAWPERLEGVSHGKVHLLGQGLPYRIDAIAGSIEVTPRTGTLPITVEVSPRAGASGIVPFTFVALTEEGEITVRGSLVSIPWQIEYRSWEALGAYDPPADWDVVRASAPIATEERSNLRLEIGGGAPASGVPTDHFATIATSTFTVPAGRYQVVIDSDDGIRVRLDGTTIHEDWTWHPTRTEVVEVDLSDQPHRFEVEHFEIDGHATLGVQLVPIPKDSR